MPEDTNDASDVFLRDLVAGTLERISVADDGTQAAGGSFLPVISGNGRYVAFMSYAANLVFDDVNGVRDVFVRDLKTGHIEMASVSSLGVASNAPAGTKKTGAGQVSRCNGRSPIRFFCAWMSGWPRNTTPRPYRVATARP